MLETWANNSQKDVSFLIVDCVTPLFTHSTFNLTNIFVSFTVFWVFFYLKWQRDLNTGQAQILNSPKLSNCWMAAKSINLKVSEIWMIYSRLSRCSTAKGSSSRLSLWGPTKFKSHKSFLFTEGSFKVEKWAVNSQDFKYVHIWNHRKDILNLL